MITQERWEEIERDFDSRYYLLGSVIPVRVIFAKSDGLKAGAIAPDVETGELTWRHDLLSRIEQSPEVEEIDRETFDRLCEGFREGRVRP